MDGKIVWYSPEKKMGLVKDEAGSIHVVHENQLKKKNLTEARIGKKISFQLGNFPGFIDKIKSAK